MTFYNQRLELYKGDERFASLEDGDKLFANNPFFEQVKMTSNSCKKQEMNSQKKPSLRVN